MSSPGATTRIVDYIALYGLNADAFDQSAITDGTILEKNWKGELLASWPAVARTSTPPAEAHPLSPATDEPEPSPLLPSRGV